MTFDGLSGEEAAKGAPVPAALPPAAVDDVPLLEVGLAPVLAPVLLGLLPGLLPVLLPLLPHAARPRPAIVTVTASLTARCVGFMLVLSRGAHGGLVGTDSPVDHRTIGALEGPNLWPDKGLRIRCDIVTLVVSTRSAPGCGEPAADTRTTTT